jgi:hypothetical protein
MTSDGHRHLPDVSFFAAVNSSSGNFYIICEADSSRQNGNTCTLSSSTLQFTGVGGTSASAPAFAGVVALLNQKVGARVGNVNYGLYALAKAETFSSCNSTTGPGSTCVFNDITKGNIAVACQGNTANCSSTTSAVVGVTTTMTGGTTIAYGGLRLGDRAGFCQRHESHQSVVDSWAEGLYDDDHTESFGYSEPQYKPDFQGERNGDGRHTERGCLVDS